MENYLQGGGVMDEGIVQEEIRFTICTEMLVSVLVCEVMQPNECVYLIGCEQYTAYSGYADTFKAKVNFADNTPKCVTAQFILANRIDVIVFVQR
jgi:poly(ADP-ribose) glycohydrolase